jgi:cell division protein ZapE
MSKIFLQNSFKEFCEINKLEVNEQQVKIINSLEKFLDKRETFLSRLIKKKEKLCFYLYGEVGVGKTMLLNFAFERLKIRKHRQHFNEFMINFHNFRHEKKDNNTIIAFVKELKKKYDLIYLDEFQVTNIVDAMILGKLFEIIFEEKIKIIITTNTKLHDLYKDGLQRDQFLPFISIIENYSIQKELQIKDDYRTKNNEKLQQIFFPLNEKTSFRINQKFREFTRSINKESKIVTTKGRNFVINNFYSGIARFKFKDLCDNNLGAEDYINISNFCKHIFIEQIPKFNNENSNQQLRFITMIDIFYEKKIRLTLSIEENLDNLSSSNKHSEVFKRTISRMFEMTKSP